MRQTVYVIQFDTGEYFYKSRQHPFNKEIQKVPFEKAKVFKRRGDASNSISFNELKDINVVECELTLERRLYF